MWTFLRPARQLTLALAAAASVASFAHAQNTSVNNQNYGFNLPHAPAPSGFDEVRASDGTTCRSSMASNGAYLDVGGIGAPNNGTTGNYEGTVYGRIIIPLGQRPDRVNCSSLYNLEIERLRHELRLARGGVANGQAQKPDQAGWQDEGWNNQAQSN